MATTAMACFTSLAAGTGARPFTTKPATTVVARRRRGLVVRAENKDNLDKSAISGQDNLDKSVISGQDNLDKSAISGRLRDTLSFLSFTSTAAERINGRLAMVGFVSALAVEASRGDSLLTQVSSGSGLAWFMISATVLSVASLVPLLEGVRVEDRSGKVMTADAELWNGRVAMVGIVALAATEYLKGTPFINV